MSRARRALGAAGEEAVAQWYLDNGYRIHARNWRCRQGELDLVVGKDGLVAFCEVKTRSSAAFGSPFEAVTAAKRARIRRVAMAWLDHSGVHGVELRFDVAGVLAGEVEVLTEAF